MKFLTLVLLVMLLIDNFKQNILPQQCPELRYCIDFELFLPMIGGN